MSDRFAKFYQSLDGFNFRALVLDWCSQGATLENPATYRVTSISEEGDQVETSLELLEAAVSYPMEGQTNQDTNLVAQAQQIASLYQEISRTPFPYKEVRDLLQEAGTTCDSLIPDLDLYFSTLAGYCSWGRRLLMWDDEKVQEAKAYVTQGFYDRHPEYSLLGPFINASGLIKQLSTYEEMRKRLLTLLISLEHYRSD